MKAILLVFSRLNQVSVNSPSPMETDTSSGTQVTVVAMVLAWVTNKRLIVWRSERFQLTVLKWFEDACVRVCVCAYVYYCIHWHSTK